MALADATRSQLSPALVNTFLPHRKTVLEQFLSTPVTDAAPASNPVVPLTATRGQTLQVKMTMDNRGTLRWTNSNGITLIPVSTHKWGLPKVGLGAEAFHRESTTFTFNVVAPTTPGTYPFQWQMARNGVGFGTKTTLVNITVK